MFSLKVIEELEISNKYWKPKNDGKGGLEELNLNLFALKKKCLNYTESNNLGINYVNESE